MQQAKEHGGIKKARVCENVFQNRCAQVRGLEACIQVCRALRPGTLHG